MAVSAKLYGNMVLKALNKEIDYDSDTIKVMLCTSGYVPDQDAHIYKSSITNEVVGTGYTAGGQALTSKTITYTGSTNTIEIDAADNVWTSATITARYAVIYDAQTGADATDPLLAYIDFGADVVSGGGNFTVTWDAAGIATVTAS